MRFTQSNSQLSVRAISGLEMVLFGFNVPDNQRTNLLGFRIRKRKRDSTYYELNDGKCFKGTDESLIQDFLWGDYSVDPAKTYHYQISAVYGSPGQTTESEVLEFEVKTEDPQHKAHAVFFNRGVAGSQAYSKRFGIYKRSYKSDSLETVSSEIKYQEFIKPDDVPDGEAFKWLSRGLEEALLDYVAQAKDSTYAIRASLYELSHVPAAQAFVDALERGADVKIIHHAKPKRAYKMGRSKDSNVKVSTHVEYTDKGTNEIIDTKKYSGELRKVDTLEGITSTALETVGKVGLKNPENQDAFSEMLIQRTDTTISHNKFIILLKDGKPIQVWTGSTNITGGGIFGQSNVGHIIRDEAIAQAYLDYWNKLSEDPPKRKGRAANSPEAMYDWIDQHNPDLGAIEPNSTHAIFSPRKNDDMLQWYADRMAEAKQSVFFTAAFSMDQKVFDVLKAGGAETDSLMLRYLLLESDRGLMRTKMDGLRGEKAYKNKGKNYNRIAVGDTFRKRPGENPDVPLDFLTGLNDHVNYIHTKYMVIDALTDDPLVVSGSANFSEASTVKNDENMLIIRGNTRIADMFVCEFMRLFNHFKRRNDSNRLDDETYKESQYLKSDASWTDPFYTEGDHLKQQRLLFA